MKTLVPTTIAALFSAAAAYAGGIEAPVIAAPVVAPSPVASSFAGAYGALAFGHATGVYSQSAPAGVADFDNGTAYGARVGYNFQNGSFVFGGELRHLQLQDVVVSVAGFGVADEVDAVTDLRGRAGYVFGNALVYGALGYSWAEVTTVGPDADVDGLHYGMGVEFNVNENIFLGVDYTQRDMDGVAAGVGVDVGADIDTLTLSAGFRF